MHVEGTCWTNACNLLHVNVPPINYIYFDIFVWVHCKYAGKCYIPPIWSGIFIFFKHRNKACIIVTYKLTKYVDSDDSKSFNIQKSNMTWIDFLTLQIIHLHRDLQLIFVRKVVIKYCSKLFFILITNLSIFLKQCFIIYN